MTEQISSLPARSWRPIRRMITITLMLITLQIALGELVAGGANYPTTPVSIDSIGAFFSALWSAAGPILIVHFSNGLLIFLMGIATVYIALRHHKRSLTVTTVLGFVSILLAASGGYIFASSDFANGGGIFLMINAAIGAYAFLFLSLYYTK